MSVYTDVQLNTEKIVADRGNYWRYYGLRHDPFAPGLEGEVYLLPSWEQSFDLLHYLCQSSNVLLMVSGAKRGGKTTFLRQFLDHFGTESKRVCQLSGLPSLNAAHLCLALRTDFELPQSNSENLEEQLDEYLSELQQRPDLNLLVIDNAHRLPRESLQALIYLIKQQSESQMRLHILLVGESYLHDVISAMISPQEGKELIHSLILEPFTAEETSAYLKSRLQAAGLPAAMPFTNATIGRIYNMSEGIPGRINIVARQALIEAMRQRQLNSIVDFVRSRLTKILGAIMLLAMLAAFIILLPTISHYTGINARNIILQIKQKVPSQHLAPGSVNLHPVNQPLKTPVTVSNVPSDISQNPFTVPGLPPALSNAVGITHSPNISTNNAVHANPNTQLATAVPASTVVSSTPVPAPVATSPATLVPVPVTQSLTTPIAAPVAVLSSIHSAQISVTSLPSPVTQLMLQPLKLPAVLPQPVEQSVIQPTMAPPVTKQIDPSVIRKPVLPVAPVATKQASAMDPNNHYTIQLIGLSNEHSLKQFINGNHLAGHTSYIHSMKHSGGDWYVLLYGRYPTFDAATAAIHTLPKSLLSLKPWVRTIPENAQTVITVEKNNTITIKNS